MHYREIRVDLRYGTSYGKGVQAELAAPDFFRLVCCIPAFLPTRDDSQLAGILKELNKGPKRNTWPHFRHSLLNIELKLISPPVLPPYYFALLHANAISNIPTSSLRGSDDLHHVTTLHSIVSGHGIVRLDTGQLRLLQTVPPQQLLFLVLRQDLVLRHEFVLRNVHQELGLLKVLNAEGIADLLHGLLGEGGYVHSQDEDGVRDSLLLHSVRVHLDRLDPDLFILGKEDEQLIGFIIRFFLRMGGGDSKKY